MLISARYESEKIKVLHAERVDETINYLRDLKKDQSNGFSKDRTMRRVCSAPILTLMEYDRFNPGFLDIIHGRIHVDRIERDKAFKKFLNSDYAKPFMTVEAIKHG